MMVITTQVSKLKKNKTTLIAPLKWVNLQYTELHLNKFI